MAAPTAQRSVTGIFYIFRNAAVVSRSCALSSSKISRRLNTLHYGIKKESILPRFNVPRPNIVSICEHHHSSCGTVSSDCGFKQNCWKCDEEIDPKESQYFCGCGIIQPPVPERTYFQVVEVPEEFDLDLKQLTKNFRQFQSKLHPDKFAQKSEVEKAFSEEQSTNLNQAYFTLLKPLSRGLYMLKLHGHSIEESEIQAEPEFLMEIMETNEDLVEAETLERVQQIHEINAQNLEKYIVLTSEAMETRDFELAKQHLTKLKYYSNIEEKAKDLEMMHTIGK